jgi:tRNA 2-selenouridine synthase
MITEINIEEYLKLSIDIPIIDVRSPVEFDKGHIPDAINIPVFSNEERAHVGTVYKQNSKEEAIKLGLEFVNPKLDFFIQRSF